MPHGRQKRVHDNYGGHINVRAVRAAMNLEGDSPREVAMEGGDNEMDASLNSSFKSDVEVSDIDELEAEGEEENAEQFVHDSLTTFMSFKPISKDKVLVILADSCSVYLKGKVQVKVLQGSVTVLGHSLQPSGRFIPIYSPRGYSLLDLQAHGAAPPQDLQAKLMAEGVAFDDAKEVKGDCVLVVRRLAEAWTKYLHTCLNVKTKMNLLNRDQNLPAELQHEEEVAAVEKVLDINLVHPEAGHLRLFRPGEDWGLGLESVDITRRSGAQPRWAPHLSRKSLYNSITLFLKDQIY